MVDDLPNRTNAVTPAQFGRRLREHREHHRITLEAISSSTKIKASLLAGLERGDIAEWPAGIFERAFVRSYARAIGLPPEPVLAEFLRVFGEDNDAAGDKPADGGLRLSLAEPDDGSPSYGQVAAALGEAAGIAALAAAVSWIAATGFGAMCGAFALFYYPLATAWLGCTPATWYLKRDAALWNLGRRQSSSPAAAHKRELYLVKPTAESELPLAVPESADLDAESLHRRSAAR
jgi:hypothetical protein